MTLIDTLEYFIDDQRGRLQDIEWEIREETKKQQPVATEAPQPMPLSAPAPVLTQAPQPATLPPVTPPAPPAPPTTETQP